MPIPTRLIYALHHGSFCLMCCTLQVLLDNPVGQIQLDTERLDSWRGTHNYPAKRFKSNAPAPVPVAAEDTDKEEEEGAAEGTEEIVHGVNIVN